MTLNDRSSRERATDLLAPYITKPAPGDMVQNLECLDQTGRTVKLRSDYYSGRPLALVFMGAMNGAGTRAWLAQWAEAEPHIKAAGANLLIFTSGTEAALAIEVRSQLALGAAICGDANGAIMARFGLLRGRDLEDDGGGQIVLITANGLIHSVTARSEDSVEETVSTLDALKAAETARANEAWIPGHAPILVIPNVLDPEDCAMLIKHYESTDGFRVDKPGPNDQSEYKFAVQDYNRQDRIDHVLRNPDIVTHLDQRIHERIVPQVQKAFAFQVERREALHIARYNGRREGLQVGHRDNVHPGSQYRRFALSISLNSDYEGGELVFREYAGRGYRGEPGTAFIFSSSLLHEIEETTSGMRYNLISHLFDNAAAQGTAR
tara:strand:- start:6027 stop:7163 length:1137 start_codon:yes stop_codon:yes gene_type:complete